jgi:hypothetical protein
MEADAQVTISNCQHGDASFLINLKRLTPGA